MDTPNGHKIAEAINDDVVVEIWKTDTEGKIYFDVVCRLDVQVEGGRALSEFLKVTDIPSLVIAVIRAMEYISVCHREIRRTGPETTTSGTTDIRTLWNPPAEKYKEGLIEHPAKSLKEIKCGAIVTELYEQDYGGIADPPEKVIRCRREFPADGQWKRSEFVQQRDLRDLIISATEIWKHLMHPAEGNTPGIRGGFYQE